MVPLKISLRERERERERERYKTKQNFASFPWFYIYNVYKHPFAKQLLTFKGYFMSLWVEIQSVLYMYQTIIKLMIPPNKGVQIYLSK